MLLQSKIDLSTAEKFCSRFAMGIRAGLDPLRILESEARSGGGRHRQATLDVRERLAAGDTLAEALSHRGDYFRGIMIQLVSAGESGGGLDRAFAHLAEHFRDLRQTRKTFIGQITWPAMQVGIAVAVLSLMIWLMGVVFGDTDYDPLGFGLKGFIGMLIFWGYLLAAAAAMGLVVVAVWRDWFGLHAVLTPLAIRVPVIGGVLKNVAMARLTMVLSLLLNAGVDAIAAVRSAFLSTHNGYYIRHMPLSVAAVRKGSSLSDTFAAAGVLPRDFLEAIEVGELSGNETESLDALSREYTERAKASMSVLAAVCSAAVRVAVMIVLAIIVIRMFMNIVVNPINQGLSELGM